MIYDGQRQYRDFPECLLTPTSAKIPAVQAKQDDLEAKINSDNN